MSISLKDVAIGIGALFLAIGMQDLLVPGAQLQVLCRQCVIMENSKQNKEHTHSIDVSMLACKCSYKASNCQPLGCSKALAEHLEMKTAEVLS